MKIITKQKIFVFIYLTVIDNFLITTPAIIFYKNSTWLNFTKDDQTSGLKNIVLRC